MIRQEDLRGRARRWLMPNKDKKCHGCCLLCRWYARCMEEAGSRKGVHMKKRGTKPTLAQKKYLKARGLDPEQWYVIKDTPELMEVVSRRELSRYRMRRIEGADVKLKTRTLRKEDI